MTGKTPLVCLSIFMRMAQPAKNSWSPGPWLGRPATRTILVSLSSSGCFSRGTPDWSYGSISFLSWAAGERTRGTNANAATVRKSDARMVVLVMEGANAVRDADSVGRAEGSASPPGAEPQAGPHEKIPGRHG